MSHLLPGKLPVDLLRRLLDRYASADPRLILGPGVGRDAAVIEFGDRLLVAKTDPITFAADDIGWYAVHVNANDVATTGARPQWFLATILLPQGRTDEGLVESVFQQMHDACEALDITLCGGHTEVSIGLERPLVVGLMLGEIAREKLVRADGARVGDALLLTKGVAIEGTAVLAREHPDIRRLLSAQDLERCAGFLRDPGISVVREALLACEVARVHAMHDPTEGGLATALQEMAEASKVGLRVKQDAIPIYPETRRICEALRLDPLGLLASGGLLLAVDQTDAPAVLRTLDRGGIPASQIGEVTDARSGVRLVRDREERPLPIFSRDEVARALSE